jgi:hypothetical protein
VLSVEIKGNVMYRQARLKKIEAEVRSVLCPTVQAPGTPLRDEDRQTDTVAIKVSLLKTNKPDLTGREGHHRCGTPHGALITSWPTLLTTK